jgi:hypothetical protein
MITTTASLSAGLWTSPGFSALSAGLSCCLMLRASFLRPSCLRLKMITRPLTSRQLGDLLPTHQPIRLSNHQITELVIFTPQSIKHKRVTSRVMVLDLDHRDCEICKTLTIELTIGRRDFVVVESASSEFPCSSYRIRLLMSPLCRANTDLAINSPPITHQSMLLTMFQMTRLDRPWLTYE